MTQLRAVVVSLQKTLRPWLVLGPLTLAACLTTLLLLGGGRPVRAVPLFQSPPPAPPEQPTDTPPPPPTDTPAPPPTEAPPAETPTVAPSPAQATATPAPPTATPTDTPTRRSRRTRTPADDEGQPGETPQFIVDAAKLIDTLVLYGARVWRCCCGYSALIWVPALLILLYIGGRRQLRPRKRRSRRATGKGRWKYWEDEWEEPSTSWDTYDEER